MASWGGWSVSGVHVDDVLHVVDRGCSASGALEVGGAATSVDGGGTRKAGP